jgi:aldose 1-epimerase
VIVELVAGRDRARVDSSAGGRLAGLLAGGRQRLIERPQPGSPFPEISWGSFLMAPWVGRVRDGRLEWGGDTFDLNPNLGGHAIHGACFDRPWQVGRRTDRSVELSVEIDSARWPFGGTARQRISLEGGSLTCAASIRADVPMPAALGWHPWFRRDPGADLALTVAADRRLELDPALIPTGRSLPVEGSFDLRAGPLLGDRRLDDVYIDARGPAIVRWPDLELQIEFGAPVVSVVVFSPPGAVCVEPATAWPDAVRLSADGLPGTGLAMLAAGQELAATMTWRW